MGWVKLDDGFPLHPKIVGLSLEARWAYVEALCYAARYQTDGEVPLAVAANGRVRDELIACGLWESLENSVSIHDYLDWNLSRKQALALSKKRAKAGAKGAARRWQMSSQRDGSRTSSGLEVGGGGLGEGAAAFDAFWDAYPRKVGKPKARVAFARALTRIDPETIILGARRYGEDPNREDAYTAHPTTWLTRDGWNDPPLPPRSAGSKHWVDRLYEGTLHGQDDSRALGG